MRLSRTALAFTVCLTAPFVLAGKNTGVGPNGVALPSSPAFSNDGVSVDMFNIVRAETAKYFAEETILSGGNRFRHERNGIPLDNITVIRSNFDAIYSYAVYDISGGLSISIPNYDLYQTVQVFDENHKTIAVVYPGESVDLKQSDVDYGEHVYLFMRTQPRTYDEKGMVEMRKRQDLVKVAAGSSKPYVSEVKYEPETFNKLRMHLLTTGVKTAVIHKGFVDDLYDIQFPHYQMVNLGGWGGLPAKHAFYFVVTPGDEASKRGECSSVTFEAPELQYDRSGFWSLTMYDELGWVVTDKFNTNSSKATANADGSYTLHFNCGDGYINNLEVTDNWNALFRNYLPTSVENIMEYQQNFVTKHKVVKLK